MRRRVVGVLLAAVLAAVALPVPPAGGAQVVPEVTHRVVDGLTSGGTAPGLTGRVVAPIPFSLVGVSVPGGAQVHLRTRDRAGPWSSWVQAEPLANDGDGPDPGSAEAAAGGGDRMSEPLWVGDASMLQVRIVGGRLADVDLHLVDSLGLSRSLLQRLLDAWRGAWEGTGLAPARATARPPVVSRAEWGADESLRRGNPSYSASTRAGILHHTAGSNDYTAAQAPGVVRAIYAYHTRSLGWSDIGYNLLVDRFGTVYEGRAGGLDRGVIGAHAGGFNTETFGVSILGTFMSSLPPGPALDAAAAAVAWKFGVHGIDPDPNATVVLTSRGSTRYPEGHQARLHTLAAHRDVSATACPGDALYAHLPALREQVRARSGAPPPPPPADPGLRLPRLFRDLPLPGDAPDTPEAVENLDLPVPEPVGDLDLPVRRPVDVDLPGPEPAGLDLG